MVVLRELSSEFTDDEVDRIFGALADATRRSIVAEVMIHEQSISSLAQRYSMSFAAVQKHIAVLERASLITKQRNGREQIVHGNPELLKKVSALLDKYEELWRQRVQGIDAILTDNKRRQKS